jgi:polysaccharide biosynthesis transport protein
VPQHAPGARVGVPLEAVEALAREIMIAGGRSRRITVMGAERHLGATVAAVTLARSLARRGRVILVDLAFASPNVSVIASDRSGPGITDLGRGTASYGEIISSDRHSPLHLVTAGRSTADGATILTSQRLAIAIEALAQSYDHLVIDGGVLPAFATDVIAKVAPSAILVATAARDLATIEARERLLGAGFSDVTVLVSAPLETQAAA